MKLIEDKIINLFRDFRWLEGAPAPILAGRLPEEIFLEMEKFTVQCKEIKQHPLYFLRNHKNVGNNRFQVSIPAPQLEDSFTFAYLINLGMYFVHILQGRSFDSLSRKITFCKNDRHFDMYDFWINFIEPGDASIWHEHLGAIAGVIYMDNDINLPTKFQNGFTYNGKKGDVILFPSTLPHMVERNETNTTRLTYAFNLDLID